MSRCRPAVESRIGEFTELVATAISNVQARSDLAASRARIVAAADDERRRVVRDLHDGAQQRLVHTVVTLKLASQALAERHGGRAGARRPRRSTMRSRRPTSCASSRTASCRRSSRTAGCARASTALASRMPVPVEIDVSVGRLSAAIEATAYFVVAEALTNVAKHAHARSAAVSARIEDDTLRVTVRDDGVGGATLDGSGLLGLRDRLATLDGRLRVESPPRTARWSQRTSPSATSS